MQLSCWMKHRSDMPKFTIRMNFIFVDFIDVSLTNWVKPKGLYVKFVICRSLHINKIYKNSNSFHIIATSSSKL